MLTGIAPQKHDCKDHKSFWCRPFMDTSRSYRYVSQATPTCYRATKCDVIVLTEAPATLLLAPSHLFSIAL